MAFDEAPPFWWQRPGPLAFVLSPLSWIWGAGTVMRMERPPSGSVPVPVLCVGNFIAGGAGKTPTAIAIARAAARKGYKPGFLSRGYGGHLSGPVVVSREKHRAADVGDEPLLLVREAVTVVSADRPSGAEMLIASGCNFIIMDDGFQNPALAKDYSLLVVDAKRGIGNGFTMPAGPLRAPLARQIGLASAVLIIGEAPGGDRVIRFAARAAKPIYIGKVTAIGKIGWRGKRVFAFAGIADPSKLFDTLREIGAVVAGTRSFPDHHFYTDEEIADLLEKAEEAEAELVTTTKDMARISTMSSTGRSRELAERAEVLEIRLDFEDRRTLDIIIDTTAANAQIRQAAIP